MSILHEYSLKTVDLQSQIQLIIDGIQEPSYESDIFSMLERQRTIQYIDFPQYYREKNVLEKAEISYKQKIQSTQLVFGQLNIPSVQLKSKLALIYWNQGRWKEAEELRVQVMEISKRVLDKEHPDTLSSMANLALTNQDQGQWKEAEELGVQVMEIRKRVLGKEHPNTLTSIANLASTYQDQGQ